MEEKTKIERSGSVYRQNRMKQFLAFSIASFIIIGAAVGILLSQTVKTFTVSFYIDSACVKTVKIKSGEVLNKNTAPFSDIEGYEVEYWTTDTSFTKPYNFTKPIKNNLKIYARLMPKSVTMKIYINDDLDDEPIILTDLYDTPVSLMQAVIDKLQTSDKNVNYDLIGFTTDLNKGEVIQLGDCVNFSEATYYAVWQGKEQVVSFMVDANAKRPNSEEPVVLHDVQIRYNENYKIDLMQEYFANIYYDEENAPNRGARLIGFQKDGEGKFYGNDDVIQITGATTLTMVFEETGNSVTIDYKNGNTGGPFYGIGTNLWAEADISKEYHTLKGYCTTDITSDETGYTIYSGEQINTFNVAEGNITFYAVWERDILQLMIEGGEGEFNGEATALVGAGLSYTLPRANAFTAPEGKALDYFMSDSGKKYSEGTTIGNIGTDALTFTAYYKEMLAMQGYTFYKGAEDYYSYIEYGAYPQNFVGSDLNIILEAWYNANSPEPAGSYETNADALSIGKYTPKSNNMYQYTDGNFYVRAASILYSMGGKTFRDGTTIGQNGTWYWFRVEPIRWVALNYDAVSEGTANEIELIAENVLVANVPFYQNSSDANRTMWQNSTLRAWLNGTNVNDIIENGNIEYTASNGGNFSGKGFIHEAFSNDEREKIAITTLMNNDNTGAGHYSEGVAGFETVDQLYSLTYYDMFHPSSSYKWLFGTSVNRRCSPTDFAMVNKVSLAMGDSTITSYRSGTATWWLRSTSSANYAYGVSPYGGNDSQNNVTMLTRGIRPAMRLEIAIEDSGDLNS